MRSHPDPPAALRALLAAGAPVRCPGVDGGVAARLAAAHGFDAVYVSGAGTAAAHGLPDMGLLTLTELCAKRARGRERVRTSDRRRRGYRLR